MIETDDIKEKAEDLVSHVGEYLDTWIKLSAVKITEKAATTVSGLISMLVICITGALFILFGSFGLGWWLGAELHNRAAGFFIVAGFWLLLALFFLLLRRKTIFPWVRNMIIRKIYE